MASDKKLQVNSPKSLSESSHSIGSANNKWRGSAFELPQNVVTDSSPQCIIDSKVPFWTSKRFTLAVLCFVCCVLSQASRYNLSIAIVSMVDHSQDIVNTTHTRALNVNTHACSNIVEGRDSKGEFNWDKQLQGLILGAFFWGYCILQSASGWICEKYGVKRVMMVAFSITTIICLVSPLCARTSPYLFICLRIALGLFQCPLYPSVQVILTSWIPPSERSRIYGFTFSGSALGVAAMLPIGGFLCKYGFDGGWPSVFYVVGICTFVLTVAWYFFVFNSPQEHPTITEAELKYIAVSLGQNSNKQKRLQKMVIPWKSIITSTATWAIIVTHILMNYGHYMLVTQLPTYMKEVLNFDIQSNGIYTMLPFLCLWIVWMLGGVISDYVIANQIFSVCNTRKLMTAVGALGSGVFLIGLSYIGCDQKILAVALVTIAVAVEGFSLSGFFINTTDIAPAFAGTILGISNSVATLPGVIAPYVVGVLTPHGTRDEWQVTFYIAGGIFFSAAVFFGIFAKGEIQEWGFPLRLEEEIPLSDLSCKNKRQLINT